MSLALGIVFATFVALGLLPCLYLIIEDCTAFLGRSPRVVDEGDARI